LGTIVEVSHARCRPPGFERKRRSLRRS